MDRSSQATTGGKAEGAGLHRRSSVVTVQRAPFVSEGLDVDRADI
jgi:hypothetical protein